MTEAIIMTVESVRTRASTNEALVTFSVPLENAGLVSSFMAQIGKQVGAAFANIDPNNGKPDRLGGDASKPPIRETKPYGREARALKLSGFFRVPEVWRVIGTDKEYREWVQKQPSAHSGGTDWMDAIGEGRCEAAHVRRINTGAGMQIKNEYACIPLTHREHLLQSDKGEGVFDDRNAAGALIGEPGHEWMERMRIQYVQDWCWECVKKELGYDSMGNVPPAKLYTWAQENGIEKYLPVEYLG